MPLFSQTYHELRREGLPFKRQYDDSKAPVLTPPSTAPSSARPRRTSEVDLISSAETTAIMLTDFLSNAETIQDLTGNGVFQDVLENCQRLVRTLQQTIEQKVVEDAEDLTEFFSANDNLQTSMHLWEEIRDGKIKLPLPRPVSSGGGCEKRVDGSITVWR